MNFSNRGLLAVIACGVALLPFVCQADQSGWEAAIKKVAASADEYREYALSRDSELIVTSGIAFTKADEHKCAILGRLLGKADTIHDIETFEYPPMDERSDPFDLWLFAISLDNWVGSARWALDAEEHTRINTWNLDCVGRYAIPSSAGLQSTLPDAEFRLDGTELYVYGDIESGFFSRFTGIVDANPNLTRIWLGSAGGSVVDAVDAGMLIRSRKIDTALFGNCYSACPLIFMGGEHREMWAGSGPHRLGFHQVYTGSGVAVPLEDPAYTLIISYLSNMGIDPVPVVSWMMATPPWDIYEPDLGGLCKPRVATFVQRVCNAE